MANKLIVSLSPHVHGGDSVQKNMYGVLIALIPALLVSFYMFGLGAVVVTLTSVIACLFFEWAITKFILKRERTTIMDGSAALTGVLLAFNLPSNLPLWIIIIGALVAIGIGKMTFGGLGCNTPNQLYIWYLYLSTNFYNYLQVFLLYTIFLLNECNCLAADCQFLVGRNHTYRHF